MSLQFIGILYGFLYFFLTSCAAATDVTEAPVSVTALGGTNAQFHCAGTGNAITWEVDGLAFTHLDILARGITVVTLPSSGTVQSNLTVPATSVNNGTTVRCAIGASQYSYTAFSNYSTLTVLPGVGHVENLRFDPDFTAVMWDPPLTAGTLDSLYYHVMVVNNDTGITIVSNTTTKTSFTLPDVQLCHYYTANVTACSSEYLGDSVAIKERSPGEYYTVTVISQVIRFNSSNVTVVLTIGLNLKLPNTVLPCCNQRLLFVTHLQSNKSNITTHPDYAIKGSGEVVYCITTGIERKHLYTATVSLVGIEGVVQVLMLNFNTCQVQHCDVHTDHTSYILMECTFAINSTAPGFVLIQDEHSQYTINTTLQRHEGDVSKGSVNITDLPAGEYRVTVYDEMEDYLNSISACTFMYSKPLRIVRPIHIDSPANLSTTFYDSARVSTFATASPYYNSSFHSTATPKNESKSTDIIIVSASIAVTFALVGIIVIVIIVIIVIVCLLNHRKNHKKVLVTDAAATPASSSQPTTTTQLQTDKKPSSLKPEDPPLHDVFPASKINDLDKDSVSVKDADVKEEIKPCNPIMTETDSESDSESTSSNTPPTARSDTTSSNTPPTAHSGSTPSNTPLTAHSGSTPSSTPPTARSDTTSSNTPPTAHSDSTPSNTPPTAHSGSTPSSTPPTARSGSTPSSTPPTARSGSTPSTTPPTDPSYVENREPQIIFGLSKSFPDKSFVKYIDDDSIQPNQEISKFDKDFERP